jgi:hypothetical protein
LMQTFWTFKFNFDVNILALFSWQLFWLLFPQIWQIFFLIIWSHCTGPGSI